MLIHWIWLATRKMGDHTRSVLLSHFSDAEELYFAEKQAYDRFGLSAEALESLMDKDLTECGRVLDACTDEKIHVLTIQDAAYPARLKNIPDPPVVLYYKGQLPHFDDLPVIGVVGTRQATPYGLGVAKRMGYQIASCGGVVVSGAAFGIDAMAMKGALTAGSPVVGVLGCGADIVYPLSNKFLYADTEKYGCLLTEFPPGTPPMGRNFPRRNRIISGLSCGVLVVEAPAKSGALITAKLAADQGRDVFVTPSNIDVDSGQGSNSLLRDGAIAVSSGWDILSEYEHLFPGKVSPGGKNARLQAYPSEIRETEVQVAQKREKPTKSAPSKKAQRKKVIDNPQNDAYSDFKKTEIPLTADEQTIVDLLQNGQRLVDDVIAESGKSAGVILASLTLLEVKGIIRRLPGRRIELAGGR